MIFFYSVIRGVIASSILTSLYMLVKGLLLLIQQESKLRDAGATKVVLSVGLLSLSWWVWEIVSAKKGRFISSLQDNI